MQMVRWIIVVLVCSMLAATAAWLVAKQTNGPLRFDSMDKPPEMTAAELLQQARHVLDSAAPTLRAEPPISDSTSSAEWLRSARRSTRKRSLQHGTNSSSC